MGNLNSEYWSNRYNENQIGWDLGEISPPIKAYIDQLEDKNLNILIPGCGLGHEAEYLFNKGFYNTNVLDFASEPILNFQNRNPKQAPEITTLNPAIFTWPLKKAIAPHDKVEIASTPPAIPSELSRRFMLFVMIKIQKIESNKFSS